jgi:hypothetical protein
VIDASLVAHAQKMPLVRSYPIPVLNGVFFPPSIKLLPVIALGLNLLAFLLVMISLGSPTWTYYTIGSGGTKTYRTIGLTRDCERMGETQYGEKTGPDDCTDLASSDGDLTKDFLMSSMGKSNLGACVFFTVMAFLNNILMLAVGAMAAFHFIAHPWVYRVVHVAIAVLSVIQPCFQFLAWVCWLQINTDISRTKGVTDVNVGTGWGTSFFLQILDVAIMGLYIASAFFDSQIPPFFPWLSLFCSRPEEKIFDTPCCGLGPTVNVITKNDDDGEDDGNAGENFVPAQLAADTVQGTTVSQAVVVDADTPFTPGEVVVGQFDFKGEGDEDLPFSQGMRLVIKEDMGESWYVAALEDDPSSTGSIPGNYVKRA